MFKRSPPPRDRAPGTCVGDPKTCSLSCFSARSADAMVVVVVVVPLHPQSHPLQHAPPAVIVVDDPEHPLWREAVCVTALLAATARSFSCGTCGVGISSFTTLTGDEAVCRAITGPSSSPSGSISATKASCVDVTCTIKRGTDSSKVLLVSKCSRHHPAILKNIPQKTHTISRTFVSPRGVYLLYS